LSYVSVEISDTAFRLSTGGSVYTEGVGSDSYSESKFQLESGGFREGHSQDFVDWLEEFRSARGTLAVEDLSDDSDLDLAEDVPSDGWDRLARYWDKRGEGEFGY
jgi:hypothetical protein